MLGVEHRRDYQAYCTGLGLSISRACPLILRAAQTSVTGLSMKSMGSTRPAVAAFTTSSLHVPNSKGPDSY